MSEWPSAIKVMKGGNSLQRYTNNSNNWQPSGSRTKNPKIAAGTGYHLLIETLFYFC